MGHVGEVGRVEPEVARLWEVRPKANRHDAKDAKKSGE